MSERGALLYFEDETPAALRLAEAADLVPHRVQRHRFPDGEIQLTLPTRLPPRVVLLRSLQQPNDKLTELLLVAPTARQLGAAGAHRPGAQADRDRPLAHGRAPECAVLSSPNGVTI